MSFTPRQIEAIDLRGKNILVAAAAGSGKTTILVERIKKLIIQDGVSIDQMLVVTFTNAAASEMREKIIRAINEEIEKGEAEGRDTSFLRHQIDVIHNANISTFHAFGIEVIRENFHRLGLEPGFGICNEAQSSILKEDALDKLLDEEYEKSEESFIDFLDAFGSERNDSSIKNMIKDGYEAVMSLPYPWKWMQEKIDFLDKPSRESKLFETIAKMCKKDMQRALELTDSALILARNADIPKIYDKLVAEQDILKAALESVSLSSDETGYTQVGAALRSISFPKLSADTEEKFYYENVKKSITYFRDGYKKIIKDLIDQFYYDSEEKVCDDLRDVLGRTKVFFELIKRFSNIYREAKLDNNLLDFSDIEHYALEALDDEEVQKTYRDRFAHIFVDEYQDSNLVQEEIINKISRNNNVFLVGDVKQSIYKFRLAEPEIFYNKYKEFAKEDNKDSVKIDLNMNFRSKGKVIESVNLFFERLMEEYDDDSALHKGDSYEGELDYSTEIHLVDDSIDEIEDMDDAIIQLERAQKEAIVAAQIIQENLGKEIYDSKSQKVRKIQKKDIVILMKSVKTYAQTFYNVFTEYDIPNFINDTEGYYDTIEINTFINLLSVIDNKKNDIPLISVLYSDIFKFSVEDLVDIRTNTPKGPFYQAWMNYAKNGENHQLREKCEMSLEKIDGWKKLSMSLPLDKFIWELMLDSKFYLAMGALPSGVQRQANLRSLVDKAIDFEKKQMASLFNFIRYIDAVKDKKVNIGQVKMVGENDDLVRIMTIHKSKGLEFPVVILAGIGKKLLGDKRSVAFHKEYGMGLPLINVKDHWQKHTVLENAIKLQNKRERVEEDVRVLYVALTRAKDKLILLGTVKDMEQLRQKAQLGVVEKNSYLDMIISIASKEKGIVIHHHDLDSIGKKVYQKKRKLEQVLSLFDNEEHIADEKLAKEVANRIGYEYPYRKALDLKFKYSVSELNAAQKPAVEAVTSKLPKSEGLTAAEKGTAYHTVMEHLPFEDMGDQASRIGVIKATIGDLVLREILTQEEAAAVDPVQVEAFFNSPLGERAIAAAKQGKLFKETPFTYAMEMEGEEVLVQGIIDAFFEEEGELLLIDYKTNYIDKNRDAEEEKHRIEEMYKVQIKIYKEALALGKGKNVKEAYIYLNGLSEFVNMS